MHVTNLPYDTRERNGPTHSRNTRNRKQNVGSQNSETIKASSESPSQLRPLADLGAEEEDEVDEATETEGYEADGGHGPGGAHVLEH
jgi:hypothetical protein